LARMKAAAAAIQVKVTNAQFITIRVPGRISPLCFQELIRL
jgi:hypothetical protein